MLLDISFGAYKEPEKTKLHAKARDHKINEFRRPGKMNKTNPHKHGTLSAVRREIRCAKPKKCQIPPKGSYSRRPPRPPGSPSHYHQHHRHRVLIGSHNASPARVSSGSPARLHRQDIISLPRKTPSPRYLAR